MVKQRVVSALVALPIVVAAAWFGEPWFTMLVVVCGVIAAAEFYRLVRATRVSPLTYFGLAWTLLFIISRDTNVISITKLNPSLLFPFLLTSAIILPLIWLLVRPRQEGAFTSWAWTLVGILYAGWMLSYLVALRSIDPARDWIGRNWIFFTFFTVFAFDSAAFFVGRAIGRHRLAPSISPGKTWEGTIGGILVALLVSLLFTLPTPLQLSLTWGEALLFGLLASIFGQLGDLAESLFKRNMGAKDSGILLPGHGGALDRIDSVVFAAVVVYYGALWVMR
ncbi:MAG: CDP-archaeol synthase [Chloroflexota bacterium]